MNRALTDNDSSLLRVDVQSIRYLWMEPGARTAVPVVVIEELLAGRRLLIETEEGARVNVSADQVVEVENVEVKIKR